MTDEQTDRQHADLWFVGHNIYYVLWIGITRKQTVTPLGEVFWIKIRWRDILHGYSVPLYEFVLEV